MRPVGKRNAHVSTGRVQTEDVGNDRDKPEEPQGGGGDSLVLIRAAAQYTALPAVPRAQHEPPSSHEGY